MVKKGTSRKVKSLTHRYLALINERRLSEAEKVLLKVKDQLKTTSWNKGYYNALEGMFATLRTKDNPYFYFTQIDPTDTKKLHQLHKEFQQEATNPLHDEFDQGFFYAWVEYFKDLRRIKKQSLEKYMQ